MLRERDLFQTFGLIVLAVGSTTFMTGPAFAGKKNPAPIAYRGDDPSALAPTARPVEQRYKTPGLSTPTEVPVSYTAPAMSYPENPNRRVQFRYTDPVVASPGVQAPASAPNYEVRSEPLAQPYQPARDLRPEPQYEPSRDIKIAALTPAERIQPKSTEFRQTAETPKRFQPTPVADFTERGTASWYGSNYTGKPTASGELFDANLLTAAHPTLPLPSLIEVTNVENGRRVVVRVNDRGPFVDNRVLDVSERAAELLGFSPDGLAEVSIRYIGPAGPGSTPQETAKAPSAPVYDLPRSQPAQPDYGRPMQASYQSAPASDPYGESYMIQVGSFSDIGNAERAYRSLSSDIDVTIEPVTVNGADYFRVVVGPVTGRDTADRMRDSLARQGFTGAIVRPAD